MKNLTLQLSETAFAQYAERSEPSDKRDDLTRGCQQLALVINQWAVTRAQARIIQGARAAAADLVGTDLPTISLIPDISAAVEETPTTPAVNVDI